MVQMEPGPIPTLMPSTPSEISSLRAFVGGDVAGDQLHFGQLALDRLAPRPSRARCGRARCRWRARPPCAPPVPARVRGNRRWRRSPRPRAGGPGCPWRSSGYFNFFWMSLTVIRPLRLYWSSTTSSFSTRCLWRIASACSSVVPTGNGDQVLLGHHLGDRQVEAVLEAQVAIGEDADQLAVLGDRHAGDAVALHQRLARRRSAARGRS